MFNILEFNKMKNDLNLPRLARYTKVIRTRNMIIYEGSCGYYHEIEHKVTKNFQVAGVITTHINKKKFSF